MLSCKYFTKLTKKKMVVVYCICSFFIVDSIELEKKLFLFDVYNDSKRTDRIVFYDADVQQAETYLFEFWLCLFNNNYDSLLIKQLLLWFYEQDVRMQCLFLGCMVENFLDYCWFEEDSFIMSLCCLNFYRLGFIDAFYFRLIINSYCLSGQLTLNNEHEFQQLVFELVAKYKQYFGCGANDEAVFGELLIYKWSEVELLGSKFGK